MENRIMGNRIETTVTRTTTARDARPVPRDRDGFDVEGIAHLCPKAFAMSMSLREVSEGWSGRTLAGLRDLAAREAV